MDPFAGIRIILGRDLAQDEKDWIQSLLVTLDSILASEPHNIQQVLNTLIKFLTNGTEGSSSGGSSPLPTHLKIVDLKKLAHKRQAIHCDISRLLYVTILLPVYLY